MFIERNMRLTYTALMAIFDPPKLKSKSIKRLRYIYPEGINRGMFAWIYFGSVAFWLLSILGFVAIIIFIALPFFGVVLNWVYQLIILVIAEVFALFFGMFMGSSIVSGVIAQGVKAGDVKLEK